MSQNIDPSPWGSRDFAAFKRFFDAEPYHQGLGITVVDRGPGRARLRLAKDENTPAGIGGSVHGGVLATMVDIATIIVIFSELGPNEQPAGTADLNITYLRPAHGAHVDADAVVIKRGRQIAVVEVQIQDDQGRLCAKGRTLYAFRA